MLILYGEIIFLIDLMMFFGVVFDLVVMGVVICNNLFFFGINFVLNLFLEIIDWIWIFVVGFVSIGWGIG